MQNKRTNKEIGEAVARNIAKFNEATHVENKPSREGASDWERLMDARQWQARKIQKIQEFMEKK